MKKIFGYFTVSAGAVLGLYLGFSGSTVYGGDVKQIYAETCELCHGANGKGTEAGKAFGVPDFTDRSYQRSRTDEDMRQSMINGTKNPNYIKVSELGVDLADLDPLVRLVREFGK
ncbi:MAG: c-type cytochrome [Candidatus Loosdrechtia sp.]|uniref:c-type cytochrome n=1 Tax=Candidatus Loosdrechtia sp. TaxID=3101272 RepID=UPI003A6D922F|nr:MAG: hypothetical protein QY305_12835 [Candidatus Jettenia sp. AMX2]